MSKYQIEHEEWVKTIKDLTRSEIAVLYYFRTLPASAQPTTASTAKDLGISRRAVQAALSALEERQLLSVTRNALLLRKVK